MTSKKYIRVRPKYIKNEQGKTTGIYLNIKTFDAICNTIKEFEQIKKSAQKKGRH